MPITLNYRRKDDELENIIKHDNFIDRDATTQLIFIDHENGLQTQDKLNDLLLTLYNRLGNETINIEEIGSVVTQEQFANWVDDHFDNYSTKLFEDGIA